MTCPDLCTAAKCEELERRISALEQALELLEASFEAHTQQDIPKAHNYEPTVNVEADISDGTLIIDVSVDDSNDSATVDLPKSQLQLGSAFENNILTIQVQDGESGDVTQVSINSQVNVEADISDGTLIVDVTVGDSNDSATVDLPESNVNVEADISDGTLIIDVTVGESNDSATVDLPESNVNVEADISDGTLIIDVTVGESNDSATVDLPESNVNVEADISDGTLIIDVTVGESNDFATVDLPESNVNVEADISDGTLIIDVTVGNRNDSATVDLPMFKPFVVLDVFPTTDNCFVIQASVNGHSDSDSFCIDIPDMNCDELRDLIIGSFNNLDNQLANLEDAINREVKDVYDQVTIDITGKANSGYQCVFETDEETGRVNTDYAQSKIVQKDYTGKGLQGIHENLKLINTNLDALHSDICKAVDPISSIGEADIFQYCTNNVEIDRSLYFNDEGGERSIGKAEQYEEDLAAAKRKYLIEQFKLSKYGTKLVQKNDEISITAPNNWITPILADFSLIQSKINKDILCDQIQSDEKGVVSIVASPKYVTNTEGKVLILHFVDLLNYPKRSRGSHYRPIQIPGALAKYDWDIHFKDLRWIQGDQYGELSLVGYKATVSGWFFDKDAGEAFFNKVLNLTTAEEKNRNFPKHKYSRTDIAVQVTRPYRAFIESVNQFGRAICHVKYMPPVKENGSE